jgi:hypothetical protein
MKITDANAAVAATLADEFAINRGGNDYKLSLQLIYDYLLADAAIGGAIALNTTFRTTTVPATYLPLAGGTVTGDILGITPTAAEHLTRKDYVDGELANYLELAGGTLSGYLSLHADPSSAMHAVTKQYADALFSIALNVPEDLDCSANPNYPVSDAGKIYRCTGTGKIGGALGKDIETQSLILCIVDDALGGTEASVGTSYITIDKGRVTASSTTEGVVKKATTGQIQTLDGTDSYFSTSQMQSVFEYVFNTVNVPNATYTVASTGLKGSIIILSTRSLLGTGIITLPDATALVFPYMTRITVKDAGGSAGINYTIINTTGGQTIDGTSAVSLNEDYQSYTFVNDGNNWFIV